MPNPLSAGAKSLHEQAIESIILATKCAQDNDQERVKMYVHQAKMFAELIARKMRAMGMHKQAEEYIKSLDEHIGRVWGIAQIKYNDENRVRVEKAKSAISNVRKTEKKSGCKCGKSDCSCKCATMEKDGECNCSFLNKGFNNPFVGSSPARKEYMQTGVVQPTWQVGKVQPHAKRSYKMIHELTSEQQSQVQQKYPQGSHAHYAYEVHPETGELAHGQRIPLPPGYAVKAHARAYKEIRPEHQRGSVVQINAPGHQKHGKKGIVLGPNPNVPGKVRVMMGPNENHSIYVEPHQVKLSKAVTRVEKALQTIFNVRKAFMKSESANDTASDAAHQDAGDEQNTNANPTDRNDS